MLFAKPKGKFRILANGFNMTETKTDLDLHICFLYLLDTEKVNLRQDTQSCWKITRIKILPSKNKKTKQKNKNQTKKKKKRKEKKKAFFFVSSGIQKELFIVNCWDSRKTVAVQFFV